MTLSATAAMDDDELARLFHVVSVVFRSSSTKSYGKICMHRFLGTDLGQLQQRLPPLRRNAAAIATGGEEVPETVRNTIELVFRPAPTTAIPSSTTTADHSSLSPTPKYQSDATTSRKALIYDALSSFALTSNGDVALPSIPLGGSKSASTFLASRYHPTVVVADDGGGGGRTDGTSLAMDETIARRLQSKLNLFNDDGVHIDHLDCCSVDEGILPHPASRTLASHAEAKKRDASPSRSYFDVQLVESHKMTEKTTTMITTTPDAGNGKREITNDDSFSSSSSSSSFSTYWESSSSSSSSSSIEAIATKRGQGEEGKSDEEEEEESSFNVDVKASKSFSRIAVPPSPPNAVVVVGGGGEGEGRERRKKAEEEEEEERYRVLLAHATHLVCHFTCYGEETNPGNLTDVAERDRTPNTTTSSSGANDAAADGESANNDAKEYERTVGDVNKALKRTMEIYLKRETFQGPICSVVYAVDLSFLFQHRWTLRYHQQQQQRRTADDGDGGEGGGEELESSYLTLLYKEKTRLYNFLNGSHVCGSRLGSEKPLFLHFGLECKKCIPVPKDLEEYSRMLSCFFDTLKDYLVACKFRHLYDCFSSSRAHRFCQITKERHRLKPCPSIVPIVVRKEDPDYDGDSVPSSGTSTTPADRLNLFIDGDSPIHLPPFRKEEGEEGGTYVNLEEYAKTLVYKKIFGLERWSEDKICVIPYAKRLDALYDSLAYFYLREEPKKISPEVRECRELLFFETR